MQVFSWKERNRYYNDSYGSDSAISKRFSVVHRPPVDGATTRTVRPAQCQDGDQLQALLQYDQVKPAQASTNWLYFQTFFSTPAAIDQLRPCTFVINSCQMRRHCTRCNEPRSYRPLQPKKLR